MIFSDYNSHEMREKSCMMAMPIGAPPGILKEQGEDYDGRKG